MADAKRGIFSCGRREEFLRGIFLLGDERYRATKAVLGPKGQMWDLQTLGESRRTNLLHSQSERPRSK